MRSGLLQHQRRPAETASEYAAHHWRRRGPKSPANLTHSDQDVATGAMEIRKPARPRTRRSNPYKALSRQRVGVPQKATRPPRRECFNPRTRSTTAVNVG